VLPSPWPQGELTVLSEYLPILFLLILAVGFAGASVGISGLMGPNVPNPTKLAAYECGNEPLADVKGTRFSVKFYMVAMLFLIFDIEAVFLYPWAVVFRSLGWFGLAQMAIFIGILGIAFVYEIGRGGLEWD
jgi:NADH-quinone oxidoreductase subunit A